MVKYLSCFTQLNIWRRIEEAVTRLTRNQFVRKGTRVRIPPSPLTKKDELCGWSFLFWGGLETLLGHPKEIKLKIQGLTGICFDILI